MPIPVPCPGCRTVLQVPDQFAGRKGRCKKCQAVFPIPAPGAPQEEPPEVLPVDEPARADLDQGLQTTPGRVQRPVLQGDDGDRPRPRRLRPGEAGPKSGGVVLLVAGALAAFLVLSAGLGAALWWFLHAKIPAGADPVVPVVVNQPAAGAANNPPGADPAGAAPGAPAGEARPPAQDATKVVRQLPSNVADVAVGGGGRYLVLHLPELRKLAIFDTIEAKTTQYISLDADQVQFTAGMTKVLVALPEQNVLQRWDLATGQREVTVPSLAGMPVNGLVMGSASEGPVLVTQQGDRFGFEPLPLTFLDLRTLNALPIKHAGSERDRIHGPGFLRASADGKTIAFRRVEPGISSSGIYTVILTGDVATHYYQFGEAGHLLPSPDGQVIYSARGLFSPQVTDKGSRRGDGAYCLPTVQSNLYLTLPDLDANSHFEMVRGRDTPGKSRQKVAVHVAGDIRPLFQLSDLELPQGVRREDTRFFGTEKRIFLIPAAKAIVLIPTSNDRLVLHRFDFDEALDQTGDDYLVVTSRAPNAVSPGAALAYPMEVKSKKGGVTYRLDTGPPRMQISPEGRLAWQVPADWDAEAASVIISVSDAGKKEVLHAFKLANAAKPATAGETFAASGRMQYLAHRLQEPNLKPEETESLRKQLQFMLKEGTAPGKRPQGTGISADGPRIVRWSELLAYRNKVYAYRLDATSPAGGKVTFHLVDGPPGLTLSPDGKLNWPVPADFPAKSVTLRVRLTDQRGKTNTPSLVVQIMDWKN